MATDMVPNVLEQASDLRPGVGRCPGRSVQEVFRSDARPPSPILMSESYQFLGSQDIGFSRYYTPEFFQQEMETVWPKVWQWVCREEHIPEPGDSYVYEVGPYSIIAVRTEEGTIRAYHNSCLHRGTKFRPKEGTSHSAELQCPYHGWTWSLNGELKRVTCAWDFAHVEPKQFRLPEVRVRLWGGFVFINMDEHAPALEEYLGVLPEHFTAWPMEDLYVDMHIAKEMPCNWKAAQEAFFEAYHVKETHPQALVSVSDANAQYDVYGDNVSRMLLAYGLSSPHLAPRTEQEIIDFMMIGDRSVVGGAKLKEGETARSATAERTRRALAERYGSDFSSCSDAEAVDVIHYNLFPNMALVAGLQLPLAYRFRPIGMDPNRSLYEMIWLRPVPAGSKRPEPAEVVRLTEEQSYCTVPGMDPSLGLVFDQDIDNLRRQQQGFRAAKKFGQTLGNYQEVRARQFHRTLDKYVGCAD